jgi:hypothetical protein
VIIPSLLEKIEATSLSIAIREGGLPYPLIGMVHLLSIAWFGGMVLMSDLRLLGVAMRNRRVSDVIQQFRPWKWGGFVLVTATGLLLAWAEPIKLYKSPSFWIKMALFALVGVHAVVFRPSVYANTAVLDKGLTAKAKVAAVCSLILWTGLVVAGRWIAFDD